MENKSNESDSLKKDIENKNIVVKNLVNYYPKQYLFYIGSQNHTSFFYLYYDCHFPIEKIVIQQQFSLGRQQKVLKKWCVDFRKIAFMNKSNEIIVIRDYELEIWEIDTCYNLTKSTQFINHLECLSNSDETQNSAYEDYDDTLDQVLFQLELSKKDDWFVASEFRRKILFFQKGMEGEWKLIHTMKIHFVTFLLNELGNILILLLKEKQTYDSERFYLVIYIKNNFGEWKIAKQIDGWHYCFLDNEQFVTMNKNIITIWQLKPEKFELVQLQQLILDFQQGYELYQISSVIYMKQTQLLIVPTSLAIYFIKKKNGKFYFQQVDLKNVGLVIGPEGLLFNNIDEQVGTYRIEILKILEN